MKKKTTSCINVYTTFQLFQKSRGENINQMSKSCFSSSKKGKYCLELTLTSRPDGKAVYQRVLKFQRKSYKQLSKNVIEAN